AGTRACDGGREAVAVAATPRLPAGTPQRVRGGTGPVEGGRHEPRERVRRTHGRGPRLLVAAGDRGLLRGGRSVPPERLSAGLARTVSSVPSHRCQHLLLETGVAGLHAADHAGFEDLVAHLFARIRD